MNATEHMDALRDLARFEGELYYLHTYTYGATDLRRDPTDGDIAVFVSRYLTSGDYDPNGAVGLANVRVFADEYGDVRGVHEVYGGHGGRIIALTADALRNTDIWDTLERLDNYPCISDDELSQVEMELTDESWDGFGARDFWQSLCETYPVGEDVGMPDADTLWDWYRTASDRANVYPVVETSSVYFDTDRVAAEAEDIMRDAYPWEVCEDGTAWFVASEGAAMADAYRAARDAASQGAQVTVYGNGFMVAPRVGRSYAVTFRHITD